MTIPIVPTDDTPDFSLSMHDGEHAIAEQLTKIISTLRNCPGAKYTLQVVTGFYSNDDVYPFELDVKGAIIDQSSAIFFARHFGISMGHNPKGPFEKIKVPFKLFGSVEQVWHTYLDNTTAVQGAKAINYLLSDSPKRPNYPNGIYDFISGVTNAPFPSLHKVISGEMVVDSFGLALAIDPRFNQFLATEKMFDDTLRLFEVQEYKSEIIYLSNAIKALYEVFEKRGMKEINEAVENFKAKLESDDYFFADSKTFLSTLANSKYAECFENAKHEKGKISDLRMHDLLSIEVQFQNRIPGFGPNGLIDASNVDKVGLALHGTHWGVA